MNPTHCGRVRRAHRNTRAADRFERQRDDCVYDFPLGCFPRRYSTIHNLLRVRRFRAVSVFGDLKQQYGAGNCHLLQINSKRAGQTTGEAEETTNMPDPWRLYVKQSSATASQQQSMTAKRDASMSDSLSNLTDLIDQELNLNGTISWAMRCATCFRWFSSVDLPSIRLI